MPKAKATEVKALFEGKTALEIESYLNGYIESKETDIREMKNKAQELVDLDVNDKWFIRKSKELAEQLKSLSGDIEYMESLIQLTAPFLEKAQEKEKNNAVIAQWLESNKNALKQLYEMVDMLKQGAIKDEKWIELVDGDIKAIIDYHDFNLIQTANIIMSYVGDLKEITQLKYNNGRGFDGVFVGSKATIRINTILAWGFIVRPHYRTLVQKY